MSSLIVEADNADYSSQLPSPSPPITSIQDLLPSRARRSVNLSPSTTSFAVDQNLPSSVVVKPTQHSLDTPFPAPTSRSLCPHRTFLAFGLGPHTVPAVNMPSYLNVRPHDHRAAEGLAESTETEVLSHIDSQDPLKKFSVGPSLTTSIYHTSLIMTPLMRLPLSLRHRTESAQQLSSSCQSALAVAVADLPLPHRCALLILRSRKSEPCNLIDSSEYTLL
ncbi:hypothetical protein SISSUDRAFT_1067720 [Sistotremastrum suecicum HHB10207 ss-3]|uniref:Uncharacterized protein n=1 Tax=Sistotremastrum suecicum HHB10207 ss-3 TaxID=1314776 RepID=A0A165WST9_9AGAM|nr:hypothetical protein SISSUDRAFT_1067720 [Sistotremastrum suecicum HHB10207 ss-3]